MQQQQGNKQNIKRWRARIARQVPAEVSYGNRLPQTRQEKLELNHSRVTRLLPKMKKIPVRYEHKDIADFGGVADSYMDSNCDWWVVMEFDTNNPNHAAALDDLASGRITEVSLKHDFVDDLPIEVSLVAKGARDGTYIVEPGSEFDLRNPAHYNVPAVRDSNSSRSDNLVSASIGPADLREDFTMDTGDEKSTFRRNNNNNSGQQQQQNANGSEDVAMARISAMLQKKKERVTALLHQKQQVDNMISELQSENEDVEKLDEAQGFQKRQRTMAKQPSSRFSDGKSASSNDPEEQDDDVQMDDTIAAGSAEDSADRKSGESAGKSGNAGNSNQPGKQQQQQAPKPAPLIRSLINGLNKSGAGSGGNILSQHDKQKIVKQFSELEESNSTLKQQLQALNKQLAEARKSQKMDQNKLKQLESKAQAGEELLRNSRLEYAETVGQFAQEQGMSTEDIIAFQDKVIKGDYDQQLLDPMSRVMFNQLSQERMRQQLKANQENEEFNARLKLKSNSDLSDGLSGLRKSLGAADFMDDGNSGMEDYYDDGSGQAPMDESDGMDDTFAEEQFRPQKGRPATNNQFVNPNEDDMNDEESAGLGMPFKQQRPKENKQAVPNPAARAGKQQQRRPAVDADGDESMGDGSDADRRLPSIWKRMGLKEPKQRLQNGQFVEVNLPRQPEKRERRGSLRNNNNNAPAAPADRMVEASAGSSAMPAPQSNMSSILNSMRAMSVDMRTNCLDQSGFARKYGSHIPQPVDPRMRSESTGAWIGHNQNGKRGYN